MPSTERAMIEEKLENAKKMRAKGYPIEDIADITGLTQDEIKNL